MCFRHALHNFLFVGFAVLGVAVWLVVDLASWDENGSDVCQDEAFRSFLLDLEKAPVRVFTKSNGGETRKNCSHYKCFDIHRCGSHPKKMLVHVPPPVRFQHIVNGERKEVAPLSKEFVDVLEAVFESGFYTGNPHESCVFIPAIDVLSQLRPGVDANALSTALSLSSEFWREGKNHLVFNPFPGRDLFTGQAIKATSGLTTYTYRPGFDIAVPALSILQESSEPNVSFVPRKWLGMLIQTSEKKLTTISERLVKANPDQLTMSSKGQMSDATFCIILDLKPAPSQALSVALHHGCIPAIVVDSAVLPFSEVLDWKRFSIRIYERDLMNVLDVLEDVGERRIDQLRSQLHFVYMKYFSSWKTVTRTTLEILNDRVVPHRAKTYRDWNVSPDERERNPLFMHNVSPPKEQGFTAVILTYDRIGSLFNVITSISDTPSLSRIVVVWNNQEKAPPPASNWPKIAKSLKVIKTHANVLSNRFYPYEEIGTEAVLSMDDDIDMLTADELELGYQVWREFPDRLVGFPSRTHSWDNGTGRYRYESEWTSEISMVLTGAAFYHKYWHYVYTAAASPQAQQIKRWVDEHMNCEDIAFNFMIANSTGNPPIKVAPRKKFRCSTVQCFNQDLSLSGQYSHMVTRSECINMLVDKYGYMPLKRVDYRVDPVLYKDKLPDKLKKFVGVGSL